MWRRVVEGGREQRGGEKERIGKGVGEECKGPVCPWIPGDGQ